MQENGRLATLSRTKSIPPSGERGKRQRCFQSALPFFLSLIIREDRNHGRQLELRRVNHRTDEWAGVAQLGMSF